MNKHHGHDEPRPFNYTNLFVDVNGLPYLLGEYLNRKCLQQIDRSAINSEITIDESNAMRAIVDIKIDDIGKHSDGRIDVVGNASKQVRLLDLISQNADKYDNQLPVIKRGIIMRVNYQLENQRTRQVLRSMVEDLRITDRSYFVDINQSNINDNGIIVNFSNSTVSTINQFTHGKDRMVLRITNIQMLYESVICRGGPRIKQSLTPHPYDRVYPTDIMPGSDAEYYYHDEMQHHHFIGESSSKMQEILCPPSWAMFNVFYHFDKDGRNIVIHDQEIYDPMTTVNLIPCGTVHVNRAFIINPGHRIIFKFSVWKNDVTAVVDTLKVAKALKAKFYNCGAVEPDMGDYGSSCHCNMGPGYEPFPDIVNNPKYKMLESMLEHERKKNAENGKMIIELLDKIKQLETQIGGTETPENPKPSDPSGSSCECGCDHSDIYDRIDDLEEKVEAGSGTALTPEDIEDIFHEVESKIEGGN